MNRLHSKRTLSPVIVMEDDWSKEGPDSTMIFSAIDIKVVAYGQNHLWMNGSSLMASRDRPGNWATIGHQIHERVFEGVF